MRLHAPKRVFEWVDWEIEYAEKQGKRIVGIWAHGHNECEVPEALRKYADTVVPLNAEKIMQAIDGKRTDWENPNGEPLLAVRPEGVNHQWRKNPPRELSIDLEADERLGRVTGWAGASRQRPL